MASGTGICNPLMNTIYHLGYVAEVKQCFHALRKGKQSNDTITLSNGMKLNMQYDGDSVVDIRLYDGGEMIEYGMYDRANLRAMLRRYTKYCEADKASAARHNLS